MGNQLLIPLLDLHVSTQTYSTYGTETTDHLHDMHVINPSMMYGTTQDLQASQAAVEMSACDIGFSEDAAAACMGSLAGMTSSPSGLMHAGGVLQDALISNQTLSSIRAVLGPKVSGAQALTSALGHQALGFTTLFSSVAGLLGSAGQGNYAAANALLDCMASELSLQVGSESSSRTYLAPDLHCMIGLPSGSEMLVTISAMALA